MDLPEGTPLSAVPGWKKTYLDKLAANWITTAEQVVGVGTTPQGLHSLAQQLGLSERQTRQLVDRARTALPPVIADELGKEVDTREYGLGALPPDAQE